MPEYNVSISEKTWYLPVKVEAATPGDAREAARDMWAAGRLADVDCDLSFDISGKDGEPVEDPAAD